MFSRCIELYITCKKKLSHSYTPSCQNWKRSRQKALTKIERTLICNQLCKADCKARAFVLLPLQPMLLNPCCARGQLLYQSSCFVLHRRCTYVDIAAGYRPWGGLHWAKRTGADSINSVLIPISPLLQPVRVASLNYFADAISYADSKANQCFVNFPEGTAGLSPPSAQQGWLRQSEDWHCKGGTVGLSWHLRSLFTMWRYIVSNVLHLCNQPLTTYPVRGATDSIRCTGVNEVEKAQQIEFNAFTLINVPKWSQGQQKKAFASACVCQLS